MKCPCSMIPPDLKIIRVGNSEVGIHDLKKILRKVYMLGMEDDKALKEELLNRVQEKNYISENMKDLYAEALLREYRSFAEAQWPKKKTKESKGKNREKKPVSFFRRLFGVKGDKK